MEHKPVFVTLRNSIFIAIGLSSCSTEVKVMPSNSSSSASSSSSAASGMSSGNGGEGGSSGNAMTGSSSSSSGGVGGIGGQSMTGSGGAGGVGGQQMAGSGGAGGIGGQSMTGSGGAGGVGGQSMTGSGGAGGVGGQSMTGSGGAGGWPSVHCEGGMPVLLPNGTDSGYERCPDGTVHRVTAVQCDPMINVPNACMGTEAALSCTTDADCTAGTNGKCAHFDAKGYVDSFCECIYPCATDADCGAGKVCVCEGLANGSPVISSSAFNWSRCATSANCVTDTDCPSGECGFKKSYPGCIETVRLSCRSPADTCRVDNECPGYDTFPPVQCAPTKASNHTSYGCEFQGGCGIGRPLLVAGQARTAKKALRHDWSDFSRLPNLQSLSPEERQASSTHWLEIAALEHASIASFARFALDLLSLGAPPDLLLSAQQAAADEIEHARIAYGLASHYGGTSFGPSPLDLTGVIVLKNRRDVIAALIEEACVGETLGAAEAHCLAEIVEDAGLRAVHARIAEDEQRHAELAWRTLRFLVESADEETKRFMAQTFTRAIANASRDPAPRPKTLRNHGLLSSRELGSIRRQALREIVEPCARALLE